VNKTFHSNLTIPVSGVLNNVYLLSCAVFPLLGYRTKGQSIGLGYSKVKKNGKMWIFQFFCFSNAKTLRKRRVSIVSWKDVLYAEIDRMWRMCKVAWPEIFKRYF